MSQFAAEEFLFRTGEVASEMFFVTSGAVEEISLSKVYSKGSKRLLWLECFVEREESNT